MTDNINSPGTPVTNEDTFRQMVVAELELGRSERDMLLDVVNDLARLVLARDQVR